MKKKAAARKRKLRTQTKLLFPIHICPASLNQFAVTFYAVTEQVRKFSIYRIILR